MKNKIAILGASGSVGTQALELIHESPQDYSLELVVIGSKIKKLKKSLKNIKVKNLFVQNSIEENLSVMFPDTNIIQSKEEAFEYIKNSKLDIALNAISGFAGLDWTIELIKNNIDIALANKESLVVAGEEIVKLLQKHSSILYPVDSEHNAIYQCLNGEEAKEINKIILTCSGGPFRDFSKEKMKNITLEKTLKHPNWSMGKKITVDSATLFNKALELIEARWLFNTKNLEAIIHYESIIHSMIEFSDKTIMAQLSKPNMKQPIHYALSKGKRKAKPNWQSLNFAMVKSLNFKNIDLNQFPAITLAYKAIKKGGSYPVVLNAANEFAVEEFLNGKIDYHDIFILVQKALTNHRYENKVNIDRIKEIHLETIEYLKGK